MPRRVYSPDEKAAALETLNQFAQDIATQDLEWQFWRRTFHQGIAASPAEPSAENRQFCQKSVRIIANFANKLTERFQFLHPLAGYQWSEPANMLMKARRGFLFFSSLSVSVRSLL